MEKGEANLKNNITLLDQVSHYSDEEKQRYIRNYIEEFCNHFISNPFFEEERKVVDERIKQGYGLLNILDISYEDDNSLHYYNQINPLKKSNIMEIPEQLKISDFYTQHYKLSHQTTKTNHYLFCIKGGFYKGCSFIFYCNIKYIEIKLMTSIPKNVCDQCYIDSCKHLKTECCILV